MYATTETTCSSSRRAVPRSRYVQRCRVATVPVDVSPARSLAREATQSFSSRCLEGRRPAAPRQGQTTELAHPCYRARVEDRWEYSFMPNPPLLW